MYLIVDVFHAQVKTRYGGHVAFPEDWFPITTSYADRLALEWIQSFCCGDDDNKGEKEFEQ